MMTSDISTPRVAPALAEGWLRARSIARGLPQPVAIDGGWCVETASATERRRYVFTRPTESLSALARTVASADIVLKLFGAEAEMRACLSPAWRIDSGAVMMICDDYGSGAPQAPTGYTLELTTQGATTCASLLSKSGELAASGYAAENDGVFVYDRIVVEPEHRSRGHGRALTIALGAARRSDASTQVLVATAQGQALYTTLRWRVCSPYTTAVLAASTT
ncbi:MAG: GNAT family N-acetyltransferase [Caulobacteraceae bacterium]